MLDYALAAVFLAIGLALQWRLHRPGAAARDDAALLRVVGTFALGVGVFLAVLTVMCHG